MQVQDPQNEEQDEEAEDDKGLLDELLSGASDDEYDPEEDALAQEPKASRQQSSHEKVEPGGREIGNGHRDTGEEVGRNGQGRADTAHHYGEGARMERRASDPGYLRERREQEVGGARSIAQLHHASGKAPKNFQHRALVVGIAGGQSWLDRTVLKRHFSHFGPVLDVFTPRNTNLAYVAFESDHQLLQALDSPEHFVSGCTVRVKRAEQRPTEQGTAAEFQAHGEGRHRDGERQGEWEREVLRRREYHPREEFRRRENREEGAGRRGWDDGDKHQDWRDEIWDRDRARHARGEAARDLARERLEERAGGGRAKRGSAELPAAAEKGAVELCGVGMTLEPADPGHQGCCHVASIREGGSIFRDGRVVLGDKLVRVDSFNCVGAHRDDIKSRVLGPANGQVALEFERPGQHVFQVVVRRMPAKAAAAMGEQPRAHAAGLVESSAAKRARSPSGEKTDDGAHRRPARQTERDQQCRTQGSADADPRQQPSEACEAAPAQSFTENVEREVLQRGEQSRPAERLDSPAGAERQDRPGMTSNTGARSTRDVRQVEQVDEASGERGNSWGNGIETSRASKRPRNHSPRAHSPGVVRESGEAVEEGRPQDSHELDLVISKAVTVKDLLDGLISPLDRGEANDSGARGPLFTKEVKVDLVMSALRRLLEIRQSQSQEDSVMGQIDLKVLRSLARCLASKLEELHDMQSVVLAVDLLVALGYFELGNDEDKADGRAMMKSFVKILSRMVLNLRAADLVKIFVAFSGAGKEAGGALLDRASSYAILRRTENLLGGMEPNMVIRLTECLHELECEVPDKFAKALCPELRRALRDCRLHPPGDTKLLKVLSFMPCLYNRQDLLPILTEKMRGLFESMPSHLLAESLEILAPRDVTIHTAVLSEIARLAQVRAQEGRLSSRQAADILWGLCQLDWKEEKGGGVAASLVDVACRNLLTISESDHLAGIGWGSPYSPSAAEDEGDGGARDVDVDAPEEVRQEPPSTGDAAGVATNKEEGDGRAAGEGAAGAGGACGRDDSRNGMEADSQKVQPKSAADVGMNAADASATDVDSSPVGELRTVPEAVNHTQVQAEGNVSARGSSEAADQPARDLNTPCTLEAMADGGLGGLGAARLLWAMVKVGMIDKGKEVFDRAESILKQGYLDLGPRELADLLYAVTKDMEITLGTSLQQHMCLSAILCLKELGPGELVVTLEGLMEGGRALPSELLGKALDRVRSVRRGLSARNCDNLLTAFAKSLRTGPESTREKQDGRATRDDGCVEVEEALEIKFKRQIVREICLECSNLADRLDAQKLSHVMRSVSLFRVDLSLEEGHNLARRTLAIHGGDRNRGRAAERAGGFDNAQLIRVLGGFIASGLSSDEGAGRREDAGVQRGDRDRGAGANVVVVLLEELRGRVQRLGGDALVEAFVAVALGGATPEWNALDFIDRTSATFEVPVWQEKSKSAQSRLELMQVLLEALSSEPSQLPAGRLVDTVCACVLAERSCGARDLLHDKRVDAILHEGCKKINDIVDGRRSCALLCLMSSRFWLPSQPVLVAIVAHVAATTDTLSCRELALAVHAIAVLNQKAVARDFGKLAREAVRRLNGKPLRDWGLQFRDASTGLPLEGCKTSDGNCDRDAGSGGSDACILDLELEKCAQVAHGDQRHLLCTVSMVLWAQAVMSRYSRASVDFFQPSSSRMQGKNGRSDVKKGARNACEPTALGGGDGVLIGGAPQDDKSTSGEPDKSPHVSMEGGRQASQGSAATTAEGMLIAKACHVLASRISDGNPTSQATGNPEAENPGDSGVDAAEDVAGVAELVRLHEVFCCMDIAGRSAQQILKPRDGDAGKIFERFRSLCKRVYSADQLRHAEQRKSRYTAEICAASADLGLSLEEDILDEATAVMIPAGNAQQRVLVDVLQEDDAVDALDTGTPLLKGRRCLQRRILECHGWRIVQLRQSSWALVRHNDVEKKKFLFREDRLRAYSGAPDWSQEGSVASALEGVDGCLALLSFLEMVHCTHPEGFGALDALMITSCFRKMALPPHPSPPHKTAPPQGQAGGPLEFEVRALQNADPSLKKRVEDMLNSGLQARALALVPELSFSDSAGVLVCIAQVWAALGSPPTLLQPALLSALCDQLAKELAPRMSSSAAERLALAIFALAVPPSGASVLSVSALKAGVSAAMARCRDTSATSAAANGGSSFLAALDGIAATALVNAAALLVPRPGSSFFQAPAEASFRRVHNCLLAVEEVWDTASDSWQKQPVGPEESLSLQVTALATRLSSLVSCRSLSAAQLMLLLRCFARGTPRDASLLRALLARLSEFAAADAPVPQDAVAGAGSRGCGGGGGGDSSGPGAQALSTDDLLDVVWALVVHGFRMEVNGLPLVEALKQQRFLAALSLDDLVLLLWALAWGVIWDDDLWAKLVHRLHGTDFEDAGVGRQASADAGGDRKVLLKVKRDIMLLWAVAAAGRLRARSLARLRVVEAWRQGPEPSADVGAAEQGRWMAEEGELCRAALRRLVSMWTANEFEIRESAISPAAEKLLPDAHTDMLRQALRALRFLEPDGSFAKFPRRKSSSDKGRSHLLRFLDDDGSKCAILELEKLVLLRGCQLDQLRCQASSDVRLEVSSVLSSLGHGVTIEDEPFRKSEASAHLAHADAGDTGRVCSPKAGWIVVEGKGVSTMVNIYGRTDYTESLQPVDPFTSPHLPFTSAPALGNGTVVGSVSPAADAAAGVAPRVLNMRWRVWEDQMKAVKGFYVLPVAADVWQECQDDAVQVAALGLEGSEPASPEPPTRPAYLQQLLQQVPAAGGADVPSSADTATAGLKSTSTPREDKGPVQVAGCGGDAASSHGDQLDTGAASPDSVPGGSPGAGVDSPMEMDDDDGMDVGASGAEDGGGAASQGRGKKGKGRKRRAESKVGKRLWKVEFSKSKQRWYYFNSKTRERLWKPPEVAGWEIKPGSGKHRPYVGLKNYYYNSQTKKSTYEPPVLREK